jgi:hypothetical protein
VARRKQLGPLAVQQLTTRGGPTLGQWIEQRWAVEHAALLADSTRDRYADVYSVHIAPWLDDVPLGHFSGPLLHGWQAQRIKAGVSPGTIRKARTLLSSVLRHAAESGAISANPLSVVRAPQLAPRDAVQPLSPATVERLRAAMLNPAPREGIWACLCDPDCSGFTGKTGNAGTPRNPKCSAHVSVRCPRAALSKASARTDIELRVCPR